LCCRTPVERSPPRPVRLPHLARAGRRVRRGGHRHQGGSPADLGDGLDCPDAARVAHVGARLMGTALNRVIAALEAHGRGPRHYGSGAITAHCPGPGHWRGDLHPSLRGGWGEEFAPVYCPAGCNLGDGLPADGPTPAHPLRPPRQRPARPACNQLKAAIGKARNLAPADRCLYLWLLWSANWDTAMIPAAFQPKSQRDLSAACGLPRMTVQQSTAHLAFHGWLSLTCTREGCERAGLHPGRGHRMVYAFPGIGDDCLGPKCRLRFRPEKAARAAHF